MVVMVEHWRINYLENTIENTQTKQTHEIEPRTMEVLRLLIEKQGEVVNREEFFQHIWKGRNTVEESLSTCISELRSIFKDSAKSSLYIKTIYKKGYKFLPEAKLLESQSHKSKKLSLLSASLCVLVLVIAASFFIDRKNSDTVVQAVKNYSLFEDYAKIRDTLINMEASSASLHWQPKETEKTYSIRYLALKNIQQAAIETQLTITDQYDFVIWEYNRTTRNNADKTVVIEHLIDVLRQLQKYKQAPEIAVLPADLQLTYKQALYLIDRRGHDNLNKALALLETVVEQQPEFIMAIINQAVASRMLSFYQPTFELRKKAAYQYELILRQATAVAPTHPVVKSLTSKLDLEKRNWNEYEQALIEAVKYSPACVICVRNLAEYYLNNGFYKTAEELVVKHLDYFPLSVMMHSFLGQIYNMQADVEGARQQVNILNALGSSGGSDTLAMELNIALNEGNLEDYQTLSTAMVEKHPVYATHKEAVDAQIAGNFEKAKVILQELPSIDFNQTVSIGNFDPLIDRIYENVNKGNLRDIRLTHGWRSLDSHLTPTYGINLKKLKNRTEISSLFKNIGLLQIWQNKQQWPDYCYIESYQNSTPNYCFE